MARSNWLFAIATFALPSPALADDKWEIQPIQVGQEAVRYVQGVPTLELELNDGIVRVTPLPLDHGNLAFTIAVYNDGLEPANFGIADTTPLFGERSVRVFTKDELVRRAKNRAFWSQFGLALLGATASGLAASQQNYYSHSFVTPRGTYTSLFSAPSIYGQYQAAAIANGTTVGIALVQLQLDRTIVALGDQTVQLTTIDPGESYAGRVVLDKVKLKNLPTPITLNVNWNGESYPFTFQIAKPGTPPPPFTKLARRSNLTDFRERFAIATAVPAPNGRSQTLNEQSQVPAPTGSKRFGNSGIRCVTCQ